jgi:hypothetical protein
MWTDEVQVQPAECCPPSLGNMIKESSRRRQLTVRTTMKTQQG